MSFTEPQVEDHAGILPAAEPAPDTSLLGSLQRKRDELAKRGTREERKLVPLWEGALSVVYRYPDGGVDTIIRAAERAQAAQDQGATFNASCDVLISCCHRVEGRQPGGEWEPLDAADDRPVRFTRRLAGLLQIDVPETVKSPARFILRHVFSPLAATTGEFEGDVAILKQSAQIQQWLGGAEAAADEALRGE